MNEAKWRNVCHSRQAYDSGQTGSAEGPLEAFLEVSARCNLRCQMCAINVDQRYRPQSGRAALLEPAVFTRLEPTFATLLRAFLFGLGEPLLNPHLCEYARILAAHGVEVWFNTNGTLIDDEVAERLAVAGVSAVTVSVDGATPLTYESIRRGASFSALLRGLKALVAARERHGRPAVDLSFVAMASNLAELPALVDLGAEVGATGIHVEPLYSQSEETLEEHYRRENLGVLGRPQVEALLAEASRRAALRGVRLASRFLAETGEADYVRRATQQPVWWRCCEPWASVWITASGEVRCCCLNDTSFGSVLETSLSHIWGGDRFRAFRAEHCTGKLPATCANCRRNGRVRHSPYFAALEPVTYRPLLDSPSSPSSQGGARLWWPPPGETVADPLAVVGQLPGIPWRGRSSVEVVLDRIVVARLDRGGVVAGREFAIGIPVPYLTEGAHMLWLRPAESPTHPGWARRHVHFWRPNAGSHAATSGLFILTLPLVRPSRAATLELDGGAARAVRWLTGRGVDGLLGAAIVDTSDLERGRHTLTVRPACHPPTTVEVEKMPDIGARARPGADPHIE
jgi:MoaA/NifB/PqqE/SkfB family radical SAM enzyme